MTHQDVYLILLALANALFAYAAIGRHQPVTVILIPAGWRSRCWRCS